MRAPRVRTTGGESGDAQVGQAVQRAPSRAAVRIVNWCGGLASALLIGGASGAEEAVVEPPRPPASIWERPELLRTGGGPLDWIESRGVDLKLWLTQFYQGDVSGDGEHEWQYGGQGDLIVTADLSQFGLWEGLGLNVHAKGQFGDDTNFNGDGSILPINTAMAFPGLFGEDGDLSSVHFTQKLPGGMALAIGKIDMLDVASKTPLVGGGGILGFQNLAFAAPPSGLVPGSAFGALLSVPIERVKLTLGVYDPTDATARSGLSDPFEEGVTGLLSVTVPIAIAGRQGFHSLSAKANNVQGLNASDVAAILLPPESGAVIGQEQGEWNVTYSFQQYLVGAPGAPGGGWGIFGQIGRSDANPTPLEWFGNIGITGTGLIPGRHDDRFGFGYFQLSFSDDLVDGLREAAALIPDPPPDLFIGDEDGFELFYEAAVTGWFRLTASVQLIDPHVTASDRAVFTGLRAHVAL